MRCIHAAICFGEILDAGPLSPSECLFMYVGLKCQKFHYRNAPLPNSRAAPSKWFISPGGLLTENDVQ